MYLTGNRFSRNLCLSSKVSFTLSFFKPLEITQYFINTYHRRTTELIIQILIGQVLYYRSIYMYANNFKRPSRAGSVNHQ